MPHARSLLELLGIHSIMTRLSPGAGVGVEGRRVKCGVVSGACQTGPLPPVSGGGCPLHPHQRDCDPGTTHSMQRQDGALQHARNCTNPNASPCLTSGKTVAMSLLQTRRPRGRWRCSSRSGSMSSRRRSRNGKQYLQQCSPGRSTVANAMLTPLQDEFEAEAARYRD